MGREDKMQRKLPQAVIDAGLKADEILKELENPTVENHDLESKPIELPPDKPGETPKPETSPVAPQPTSEPPKPENKDSYWEHRFKTVQGILEAEKRRSAEHLNSQMAEINDLKAKLSEAERQKASVPKQYDLRSYLSEDEISKFGEDLPGIMMNMAAKIARESAEDAISQVVNKELAPVKSRVEQQAQRTQQEATNTFWKHLQKAVPDWMVINGDPKFHEWLSETDGMFSKNTRDQLLKYAESQMDSDTVVEMFQAFKKSLEPPPARAVETRVIPESVTTLVPDTSVDTTALFTRQQISQHYNDYARGVYKKQPEKWKALEAKINEAIRSGRVN